jgi:hypothetical protein
MFSRYTPNNEGPLVMKLPWIVVLKGTLRLVLMVVGSVIVGGAAYMLLIKLLLAVHLKALE